MLEYVVLATMGASGSRAGGLFMATIEGLTLGALGLDPQPAVMGYLAFGVTAVFLVCCDGSRRTIECERSID